MKISLNPLEVYTNFIILTETNNGCNNRQVCAPVSQNVSLVLQLVKLKIDRFLFVMSSLTRSLKTQEIAKQSLSLVH